MVIGLTGPTGSGKSLASEIFFEKGYSIINADKVAHFVYDTNKACIQEIDKAFPGVIFENSINRKKLAGIVFSNKDRLNDLNKIVHPFIVNEIKSEIKRCEKNKVLLDAPTLFESGIDRICDKVISVLADREIRIRRIVSRDNISESEAVARITSQPIDEFYKNKSDFVVFNNYDKEKLINDFENIIDKIDKDLL